MITHSHYVIALINKDNLEKNEIGTLDYEYCRHDAGVCCYHGKCNPVSQIPPAKPVAWVVSASKAPMKP